MAIKNKTQLRLGATLTTTLLLLFTQLCFAQDFWMALEVPENSRVYTVKGNAFGDTYLGTSDLFVSKDSGLSWMVTGFANAAVTIAINLENEDLFVGNHLGVFFSDNNGFSWDITIYQSNAMKVLLSSNNLLFIGYWGGVYMMNYQGDTASTVLELGSHRLVTSIIEAPNGNLYAGVTSPFETGGGVYCSLNGGHTWVYCGLQNRYINALAVNSQGVLFAGSIGEHYLGVGGVFRSTDDGETWQELKNDVLVTAIAITPDDHIYIGCTNEHGHQGGVFRSTDNGETWALVNSGLIGWSNQNIEGLSLAPDGYLYAYGNHLHRSAERVFTGTDILFDNNDRITIYPNPVKGKTINFDLGEAQIELITIYNAKGSVVDRLAVKEPASTYSHSHNLPKGIYFIVAIDRNGERYNGKFVVQ